VNRGDDGGDAGRAADGSSPSRLTGQASFLGTQPFTARRRGSTRFDFVGTPTSVKVLPLVKLTERVSPCLACYRGLRRSERPCRRGFSKCVTRTTRRRKGRSRSSWTDSSCSGSGIIYQEEAFGQAVLSGAQLALARRRLQPTAAESFARGTIEVGRACDAMKSAGAEAVLVGTYAPLARAR